MIEMEWPQNPGGPVESPKIASPFAHAEAVPSLGAGKKSKLGLWILAAVVFLVIGAVSGFFLMRYLNDPFRTLEVFPVGKYLDSYHSLAGSKFKSDLRVEADLGWKDGVGRLMLFSAPGDSRPIAVMIPAALASIYFTKGQIYLAQLEVKEGGLIYATACQKE